MTYDEATRSTTRSTATLDTVTGCANDVKTMCSKEYLTSTVEKRPLAVSKCLRANILNISPPCKSFLTFEFVHSHRTVSVIKAKVFDIRDARRLRFLSSRRGRRNSARGFRSRMSALFNNAAASSPPSSSSSSPSSSAPSSLALNGPRRSPQHGPRVGFGRPGMPSFAPRQGGPRHRLHSEIVSTPFRSSTSSPSSSSSASAPSVAATSRVLDSDVNSRRPRDHHRRRHRRHDRYVPAFDFFPSSCHQLLAEQCSNGNGNGNNNGGNNDSNNINDNGNSDVINSGSNDADNGSNNNNNSNISNVNSSSVLPPSSSSSSASRPPRPPRLRTMHVAQCLTSLLASAFNGDASTKALFSAPSASKCAMEYSTSPLYSCSADLAQHCALEFNNDYDPAAPLPSPTPSPSPSTEPESQGFFYGLLARPFSSRTTGRHGRLLGSHPRPYPPHTRPRRRRRHHYGPKDDVAPTLGCLATVPREKLTENCWSAVHAMSMVGETVVRVNKAWETANPCPRKKQKKHDKKKHDKKHKKDKKHLGRVTDSFRTSTASSSVATDPATAPIAAAPAPTDPAAAPVLGPLGGDLRYGGDVLPLLIIGANGAGLPPPHVMGTPSPSPSSSSSSSSSSATASAASPHANSITDLSGDASADANTAADDANAIAIAIAERGSFLSNALRQGLLALSTPSSSSNSLNNNDLLIMSSVPNEADDGWVLSPLAYGDAIGQSALAQAKISRLSEVDGALDGIDQWASEERARKEKNDSDDADNDRRRRRHHKFSKTTLGLVVASSVLGLFAFIYLCVRAAKARRAAAAAAAANAGAAGANAAVGGGYPGNSAPAAPRAAVVPVLVESVPYNPAAAVAAGAAVPVYATAMPIQHAPGAAPVAAGYPAAPSFGYARLHDSNNAAAASAYPGLVAAAPASSSSASSSNVASVQQPVIASPAPYIAVPLAVGVVPVQPRPSQPQPVRTIGSINGSGYQRLD